MVCSSKAQERVYRNFAASLWGTTAQRHRPGAPLSSAVELSESSVNPLLIDGGFLSVPLGGALVGQSGIQDNLIGEPGAD